MELKKQRDSFVFYRSFARAIDNLPDSLQLHLYKAISSYALDQSNPCFEDINEGYVLKALWASIKPQLDANYKRYINGTKGGAPLGSRNNPYGRNGKTNQKLTDNLPNVNVNENVDDNDNENVYDNENVEFHPPSFHEISSYISSIRSSINPERFYNHYLANGWVDKNGNPVRDWKAVIRLWQEREKPQEQPKRVYDSKVAIYAVDNNISLEKAYNLIYGAHKH